MVEIDDFAGVLLPYTRKLELASINIGICILESRDSPLDTHAAGYGRSKHNRVLSIVEKDSKRKESP